MDRITLPKKFSGLHELIALGKVRSFLIPLDQKAMNDAFNKGYKQLVIATLKPKIYIREEKMCVVAVKETNQNDDFIIIKEIPGNNYSNVPFAMSLKDTKSEYDRILHVKNGKAPYYFIPETMKDKARQFMENYELLKRDKNPATVLSTPTKWLPYVLNVSSVQLRNVREYDWNQLQKEGMTERQVTEQEYRNDIKYWSQHVNGELKFYGLEWDEDYKERNYNPSKDALYETFIKSVYGKKVWDNNETVVEITFYCGLNDKTFFNSDIFLKFCEPWLDEEFIERLRQKFEKEKLLKQCR